MAKQASYVSVSAILSSLDIKARKLLVLPENAKWSALYMTRGYGNYDYLHNNLCYGKFICTDFKVYFLHYNSKPPAVRVVALLFNPEWPDLIFVYPVCELQIYELHRLFPFMLGVIDKCHHIAIIQAK